jgi:transcription elongation factor Elf1
MGRRKRKKVVYKPVRRLPRVFSCPNCGHKTIKTRIEKDKSKAMVICGFCELEQQVEASQITEPVDAFGDFIDIYFKSQEYSRLMKRAQRLEDKQNFSELALVYEILSDICKDNSNEALKEYEANHLEEDMENAQKWKAQSDEYFRLSRDIYQKLELKELEDGIDDDIYEDVEDQQYDSDSKNGTKPKRGRDLDEILDDKGFLELD